MKKIWTSELSVYDKHVAHNTFAGFVLISTFGILGWTIREIEHINKKNKKCFVWLGIFNEILMSVGYIYKESVVKEV